MQLRNLLSCLLIGVAFVFVIVPPVRAQTTSVTVLSSPASVVISSDGTADFDTTIQVTYAGVIQQTNKVEILVAALVSLPSGLSPEGTAAANPSVCLPPAVSGPILKPGFTDCAIASVGSGTETVSFHAIIPNAAPQQYHFEVLAGLEAVTPQKNTLVEGSDSYAYFYVSMVNGATTNAMLSQTQSQPTAIQSTDNTWQLVLVLAVIVAVVLGAAFFYTRRKEQPKNLVTKAEMVDTKTEKTVPNKAFCINCGNELPADWKFCRRCGTEQP
ncbi:MAG: zinc ribbon domain-containing protein [Candidatus Bathyarchaeia archaeon]